MGRKNREHKPNWFRGFGLLSSRAHHITQESMPQKIQIIQRRSDLLDV